MDLDKDLHACAPLSLVGARCMTHKAIQLLTLAARSNLEPETDDSHSSLRWDATSKRFLSQPMPHDDGAMLIGLSLSPLRLDVVQDGTTRVKLDMEAQTTEGALQWLDRHLGQSGLNPASKVTLPYELPEAVAKLDLFSAQTASVQLTALAAWFDLANTVLSDFAKNYAYLEPGPSPVRCWPHHFDIATYVQLEACSAEAARGIGIGMSPGDESYGQALRLREPLATPGSSRSSRSAASGPLAHGRLRGSRGDSRTDPYTGRFTGCPFELRRVSVCCWSGRLGGLAHRPHFASSPPPGLRHQLRTATASLRPAILVANDARCWTPRRLAKAAREIVRHPRSRARGWDRGHPRF